MWTEEDICPFTSGRLADILIDYFLYPANNYNRTQRRSPIVPSEWVGVYPTGRVRRYPAAGYKTTQPLGIKYMKKDIKMMLL